MSVPSQPSAPAAGDHAGSPSAAPEASPAPSGAQPGSPTEKQQLDTQGQEIPDRESKDAEAEDTTAPPLPDEVPPPLPDEAPPGPPEDDGWEPKPHQASKSSLPKNPRRKLPYWGGYNPAIHGDYDPTAPYAQHYEEQTVDSNGVALDPAAAYAATGTFNRFTGRWQAESINPENHNDENKSRRQMNAFFDVDAAANAHDGRSLRAERSAKKLSKKELKMFKEKRREKKEEKRRAWLRD
ncbi:uncharacterized protein N7477_007296 [Penicillium maclennaniae]|uniref:uncharacterized protein n=1 Tax=Penicillium maclennaniae TaxID=1343394 RepID=UPI002541762F|nr:uncharacterized protein N7477_007296 [Penicillium maclennaniae]KAJ5664848.1 hypothetical protein N7477_007296 [Penicillium maclennaniae]